tara:strand:- start:41109 stop:42092 length:984 start_codon:yes stop_codon:yes gene_type:complete
MQESNKFYFRVDSSSDIGFGHLSRTKVLAEKIQDRGNQVIFLSIEEPGAIRLQSIEHRFFSSELHIIDYLKKNEKGFIVIDHYQIDSKTESILRQLARKVLVIDDLANRKHDCDFLLDQNLHPKYETRYSSLLKPHTKLLLGPKYCILSDKFQNTKSRIREEVRNILVFFGGGDHLDQTKKYLPMMTNLKEYNWEIVVGDSNKSSNEIEKACKNHSHLSFHKQINYMHELMMSSDLYFGAGGYTSLERTSVHLPGIIVTIAENQIGPTKGLADKHTCIYLGHHSEVNINKVKECLENLDEEKLKTMSLNCNSIVDGKGIERILDIIL